MAMASSSPTLLFHCLLILLLTTTTTTAQNISFRPRALVLPVSKDSSTLQYLTAISQRTPLVPLSVTLDLGGQFLWVDCDQGYVSSSYRLPRCRSAACALSGSQGCGNGCSTPLSGCSNTTCSIFPDNTVTRSGTGGNLASDVVSVSSTDGSNPGLAVLAPNLLFGCSASFLLQGLAKGAKGMAALGRGNIGLPLQFASSFSFPRKFALCLSSTPRSNGVVFFGDGPYRFLPNIDASESLIYTPLLINPVSTAGSYFAGDRSVEYFIGVKSIRVSEVAVQLNSSLLSIDSNGLGGTKISTVNPYTLLEASIYDAVTKAFEAAIGNVSRAAAVAPFGHCFSSKGIGSTRVGAAVPAVDFVLQSKNVYWRIFGANSMVDVGNDVLCLGFVDAGESPRTSIVIGGHQLEDNLLQFDLAANRLGFSSSLLFRRTSCSNFNFTSVA